MRSEKVAPAPEWSNRKLAAAVSAVAALFVFLWLLGWLGFDQVKSVLTVVMMVTVWLIDVGYWGTKLRTTNMRVHII